MADPKLLFLARSFPPTTLVSLIRAANIACELRARGWEVDVVTVEPDLVTNRTVEDLGGQLAEQHGFVRTTTGHSLRLLVPDLFGAHHRPRNRERDRRDDRDRGTLRVRRRVRGVVSRVGWAGLSRFALPDSGVGWILPVMRACAPLRPGDVDLVMATGNPWSGFVAAWMLSRRLHCPFVLDYRDPWSTNPYSPLPPASWVARVLEGYLGRKAALLTTVAPAHAEVLGNEFGLAAKTEVVTNGYPGALLDQSRVVPDADFTIVYAGSVDADRRSLSPVLGALERLRQEAPELLADARFSYFGQHGAAVAAAMRSHGNPVEWVDHGLVPHSEVLAALGRADLGIVLASDSVQPEVPAKLFDHIGAGCPTLLVGRQDSDAARTLDDVGLGLCVDHNDASGMDDALRRFLSRQVVTTIDREIQRRYSWDYLGDRLDALLRSTLADAPEPPSDRSTPRPGTLT